MLRRLFVASSVASVASGTRALRGLIAARGASTIPYDNWNAITFAKKWCGHESNVCGVYLKGPSRSDCAHFVAHCLNAGGIRIANPDAHNQLCPDGLAVRNTDLEAALRAYAAKYENVQELGLADAIVGDIGFLELHRPTHAFVICEPVDLRITPPPGVKAWAHSNNRCCDSIDAQWRQWFSSCFRLTDAK